MPNYTLIMKGNYIFLAEGYEPLEALAPMDILRRAKLDVKFVSLTDELLVPSTQGYAIEADLCWEDFYSLVELDGSDGCMIFPGGLPGADSLGSFGPLMEILSKHYDRGGLVCAICAAPARVLANCLEKRLTDRKMTVYEGFEKELSAVGADVCGDGVVVDGNLITAKGPGLAVDFGFAILSKLVDHRICDVIKHAMML